MSYGNDTITEGLIFDGALNPSTAVALGALLLALTTWLMIRDRRALGNRWAALFWMLRCAAGAVALWMAVGPVRERVHKVSVPQSIAILADQSQSMSIVDPPQPSDDVRWELAAQTEPPETDKLDETIVVVDRAAVSIALASGAVSRAQEMLVEHRPLSALEQQLDVVHNAVKHAGRFCQTIARKLSSSRDDIVDRVVRIQTVLDGPVAESLDAIDRSMENQQSAVVADLNVSLAGLADGLLSAQRRFHSLSSDALEERSGTMFGGFASNAEPNRMDRVRRALQALEQGPLTKLPEDVHVGRFLFDSFVTSVSANQNWNPPEVDENEWTAPASKQPVCTNLTSALTQLTQGQATAPTRLAVLYTDGRHNALDEASPRDAATRLTNLPLYVVPVGSAAIIRDLVLHRVKAPSTVVQHDSALIEAIVTAFDSDGQQTEVVLRHDGEVVDRKPLSFAGERVDSRITFDVAADELGWQEYELSVEPITDESSMANNVAPISWEVVKNKFTVLLSDGASQWEYRYLQQLFRRDSHVECDELLFLPRLRGTGRLAERPRLPTTVDEWAAYDVVILGDINPRHFPVKSQHALVEYVRKRDGHLILIAGRNHMPQRYANLPLAQILPVEPFTGTMYEQYTVQLSDEGRLNSALAIEDGAKLSEYTWLDIYDSKPITGLSQYCLPKSTARVLIQAIPYGATPAVGTAQKEESPAFICWHQVGAGNVVYLAAPHIWKLRYRDMPSDRRIHRFWGQLIRWMTAAHQGSGFEQVRLATDHTHYSVQQPIEVTVWLKDQTGRPLSDQDVQAVAKVMNHTVTSVPLTPDEEIAGRYAATIPGLDAGAYEITLTGEAIDQLLIGQAEQTQVRSLISVESSENLEMLDTRCDRALLEQLAALTGGQVIPPTAVPEVLELASLSPEVHEDVERFPLWNRWSHLWIIVGCLFVEWITRKAKGFV